MGRETPPVEFPEPTGLHTIWVTETGGSRVPCRHGVSVGGGLRIRPLRLGSEEEEEAPWEEGKEHFKSEPNRLRSDTSNSVLTTGGNEREESFKQAQETTHGYPNQPSSTPQSRRKRRW